MDLTVELAELLLCRATVTGDTDSALGLDTLATIARVAGVYGMWSRREAEVEADVRRDLDDLVGTYVRYFESSIDGTPAERQDELLEAKRALTKLISRRGFLSDFDTANRALAPALEFITTEFERRRARAVRSRTATKFDRLLERLPVVEGGTPLWREEFALEMLDTLRRYEPIAARSSAKKNFASLLARIEAVAFERDVSLRPRTRVAAASVYKLGKPEACRRATDRWRQVLKSVRIAELEKRRTPRS